MSTFYMAPRNITSNTSQFPRGRDFGGVRRQTWESVNGQLVRTDYDKEGKKVGGETYSTTNNLRSHRT